ncbi:MAG TPA: MFS transporter, partial [Chloroflexota bacterium]|nr:MFS transporter [Chloroflexota bacterium]
MSSQATVLGQPVRHWAPYDRIARSLVGRNAVLRRVLLAGFVSSCGDRLHQVALAALVLGMTDSMASAGLVFVVSTLPYALFGLPIGAFVDRWDRLTAMIASDLIRGVVVLAVPVAAFVNLPLVYPLLFGLTCATMIFQPARQAAIPDIVGADDLPAANILFQAVNYLVDIVALPVAGLLVVFCTLQLGLQRGAVALFSLDALSYLVSAGLLLGVPRRPSLRQESDTAAVPFASQIMEGLRFLRTNPALRTNTLLLTLGPLLLGSLHTLWIGFAWRVSNTQTVGYAVVETANAVGTLLGLWLLPQMLARVAP